MQDQRTTSNFFQKWKKNKVKLSKSWTKWIGLKWTKIYSVWILTCCIVFQFESSPSENTIRLKMNEKVVSGRDLARWQGTTTIWICQHGWCIWITIINSQWIRAENLYFYFCSFWMKSIKSLTNMKRVNQNVEN